MKKIVIALGGNALQEAGKPATAEAQLEVVEKTAEYIADIIEAGYKVVVAHGNGPQVGRIVLQNEYAVPVTPAMPFDVCGAMSQGYIGYHIQQGLTKESMAVFAILPESIQQQLFLERDPHGNVQVSLIESEKLFSEMVKENLAARKKAGTYKGKFSPLHHFLGYEGRCAFPSNFDADYCYSLGYNAFMLIQYGYTGYLSKVSNLSKPAEEWVAGGMPITKMMNIERRHGADKPVIRKALVELEGAPFKFFEAHREQWAVETCYVYPGAIQYWGPSEVCDETTRTLALEKA